MFLRCNVRSTVLFLIVLCFNTVEQVLGAIEAPTPTPTSADGQYAIPTSLSTAVLTAVPTFKPTAQPTNTAAPTCLPTLAPSPAPTIEDPPTLPPFRPEPTEAPTPAFNSSFPTEAPTKYLPQSLWPTFAPSVAPTINRTPAPFAGQSRAPTQSSHEIPFEITIEQQIEGLNAAEFTAECLLVFQQAVVNRLNEGAGPSLYVRAHSSNINILNVTDDTSASTSMSGQNQNSISISPLRALRGLVYDWKSVKRLLPISDMVRVKYESTLTPLSQVTAQTAYDSASRDLSDSQDFTAAVNAAATQNGVAILETVTAGDTVVTPILVLYPTQYPTTVPGNRDGEDTALLSAENAEGVIIGASIGAVGMIVFLGVFGYIWFKRYGQYMAMFGDHKTEVAESVDNPMFFDPSAGDGSDQFDIDSYRKKNAGSLRSADGDFDYGESLGDLSAGASDNPMFAQTSMTGSKGREEDRSTKEIAMVDLDVLTSPTGGSETDEIPGFTPSAFQPRRLSPPTHNTNSAVSPNNYNNNTVESLFDEFDAADKASDSGDDIDNIDLDL